MDRFGHTLLRQNLLFVAPPGGTRGNDGPASRGAAASFGRQLRGRTTLRRDSAIRRDSAPRGDSWQAVPR